MDANRRIAAKARAGNPDGALRRPARNGFSVGCAARKGRKRRGVKKRVPAAGMIKLPNDEIAKRWRSTVDEDGQHSFAVAL
jgi:hypothetical protein